MKRPLLALAAGILVAALLPGAAMAVSLPGSLDQSNAPGTAKVAAAATYAQTFTAGQTGVLTGIRLWASGTDSISSGAIYPTASGVPNTAIELGIVMTETPSATAGWLYFPMEFAVPVIAGDSYAIKFATTANDTVWGSGDTYSGGHAFVESGSSWGAVSATLLDFAF
jgi:ABC-type amino acid transport substrate-binding protein